MRGIVLALAGLMVLPAWAFAQDNDSNDTGNIARDAGPLEFAVSAIGQNDRQFEDGSFTLQGRAGWYLFSWLEFSARDNINYTDTKYSGHSWSNTVQGAIDFNLPLDRWEPYVGGNIGYIASDVLGSSPEAAPEIGVKYYFSKTAFAFLNAEYDFLWHDSGNNFSNGQFVYTLGVGIRL